MEIELIFRIAAVGLLLAIVNSILKNSGKDEYILLTNLSGLIMVIVMLVPYIKDFFSTIKTIFMF